MIWKKKKSDLICSHIHKKKKRPDSLGVQKDQIWTTSAVNQIIKEELRHSLCTVQRQIDNGCIIINKTIYNTSRTWTYPLTPLISF